MFPSSLRIKYISFNYPKNAPLNELACTSGSPIISSVHTYNWLACLNRASSYLYASEYKKAEVYAQKVLYWQPFNYQAIRLLGFALLKQAQVKDACALFKQYNSFFRPPTLLQDDIAQECTS